MSILEMLLNKEKKEIPPFILKEATSAVSKCLRSHFIVAVKYICFQNSTVFFPKTKENQFVCLEVLAP